MSFNRAFIIAMMTNLMIRGDGGFLHYLFVAGAGGLLWVINPDPLPGAIKRGLEAFARDYRR